MGMLNMNMNMGFSNYGPQTVHIAAPGVGIRTTHPPLPSRHEHWSRGVSACLFWSTAVLGVSCSSASKRALAVSEPAAAGIGVDRRYAVTLR
jgi:hypothetical protein